MPLGEMAAYLSAPPEKGRMMYPALSGGSGNPGVQEAFLGEVDDVICALAFVVEGNRGGNLRSLQAMKKATNNPKLKFLVVQGATHFNLLAPLNELIAKKIVAKKGPNPISLEESELNRAFAGERSALDRSGRKEAR